VSFGGEKRGGVGKERGYVAKKMKTVARSANLLVKNKAHHICPSLAVRLALPVDSTSWHVVKHFLFSRNNHCIYLFDFAMCKIKQIELNN
jgi:hypothetical protein